MSDSTLHTIGSALNRARDHDTDVQILVEGEWLCGEVVAVDGVGVVLSTAADEHAVIRIESIAAVTVAAAAPGQTRRAEFEAVPSPRSPST